MLGEYIMSERLERDLELAKVLNSFQTQYRFKLQQHQRKNNILLGSLTVVMFGLFITTLGLMGNSVINSIIESLRSLIV